MKESPPIVIPLGPPASAKYDPLGLPLSPDQGGGLGSGAVASPFATLVVPVREIRRDLPRFAERSPFALRSSCAALRRGAHAPVLEQAPEPPLSPPALLPPPPPQVREQRAVSATWCFPPRAACRIVRLSTREVSNVFERIRWYSAVFSPRTHAVL